MTYARIGIFQLDGSPAEPVVALFRDRVTPMFAAQKGFLGYQAFVDHRDATYIGISYWSSLEALEASSTAAQFARQEAASLGAQTIDEPIIVREEFDTRGTQAHH